MQTCGLFWVLSTHRLCSCGDTAHIPASRACHGGAGPGVAGLGHARCRVSAALMGRGAEKAPPETDGRDPDSARPTLALVSQPVGGLGMGAQDTGAQPLGPSVTPLFPWGRPGKADSGVPILWPPLSSQGLEGIQPGSPPWFSRPWLAPSCSSQARHQLRGVVRGHCPKSFKGKKVLWKILG